MGRGDYQKKSHGSPGIFAQLLERGVDYLNNARLPKRKTSFIQQHPQELQ